MSKVLDKQIFNALVSDVYSIKSIKLSREILNLSNGINTSTANISNGFYFRNDDIPFLLKGVELIGIDNSVYIINTKDDVIDYIMLGNNIRINNVFRLDKSNIKQYSKFVHTYNNSNTLIDMMCKYILSKFMTSYHVEADIVISDTFGISNDILLEDDFSIEYDNFTSYIADYLMIGYEFVSTDIIKLYDAIYILIEPNLDIESSNTIKINTLGNTIEIRDYPPPSAIRYLYNVLMISTDNNNNNDIIVKDVDESDLAKYMVIKNKEEVQTDGASRR